MCRRISGRCATRSPGATTCSSRRNVTLFATCAVFAGGCTLDALEAVSDAGRADGLPTQGGRWERRSGWGAGDRRVSGEPESAPASRGTRGHQVLHAADDPRLRRDVLAASADRGTHAVRVTRSTTCAWQSKGGRPGRPGPGALAVPSVRGTRQLSCGAHLEHRRARRPRQALGLAGSLARYWEMAGALEEGERWLESALRVGAGQAPELLLPAYTGAGTWPGRKGTMFGRPSCISRHSTWPGRPATGPRRRSP